MKLNQMIIAVLAIVAWGVFLGYITQDDMLEKQIAKQRAKEGERQKQKFVGLTAPRYD
ncbi:MAG: hypothetical protein VW546_09835 [Gammaproteobacteria bacterium]